MKEIVFYMERKYKTLYFLMLICSLLMYLSLTVNKYAGADEAYTLAAIQHSFSEIFAMTSADVHPPLYYFLLKLFSAPFGYSLLSAEIFSIIPFWLIISIGGFQLQRLFDKRTALLFMVLFLIFPFSMMFAVEVRMYSLAALFVFLNALYAYRSWKEEGWTNWILFSVFGVCAAYTHYFALVSAAMIYCLLLAAAAIYKRKLLRRWVLMALLTIILYIPWLKPFWEQLVYKANHEYWIESITLKTVAYYAWLLFGSDGIFAFVSFSGICYMIALLSVLYKHDKRSALIALSSLAVPVCTIATGIILSAIIRPVFVIRYVIPAVPLLIFFAAYTIGKMKKENLISVVLTVFLIGGISHYERNLTFAYMEKGNYLGTDFISNYDFVDSYIAYSGNAAHICQVLSYYDPETVIYTDGIEITGNPYHNLADLRYFNVENNEQTLLFVEVRGKIPEEFDRIYESQYIGETGVPEGGYFDVYLLTLKD